MFIDNLVYLCAWFFLCLHVLSQAVLVILILLIVNGLMEQKKKQIKIHVNALNKDHHSKQQNSKNKITRVRKINRHIPDAYITFDKLYIAILIYK